MVAKTPFKGRRQVLVNVCKLQGFSGGIIAAISLTQYFIFVRGYTLSLRIHLASCIWER